MISSHYNIYNLIELWPLRQFCTVISSSAINSLKLQQNNVSIDDLTCSQPLSPSVGSDSSPACSLDAKTPKTLPEKINQVMLCSFIVSSTYSSIIYYSEEVEHDFAESALLVSSPKAQQTRPQKAWSRKQASSIKG